MVSSKTHRFFKKILLCFVWGAVSCQGATTQLIATDIEPTFAPTAVIPTATLFPSPLPSETPTIAPTASHTPQPTAMDTPTPTLIPPTFTAVSSPTFTPTPEPTLAGQPCPNPVPVKPEYERYILSSNVWPSPDPNNQMAHFWLDKPLPGGGRLLINKTYPYGYDGNGRYLLHNGVDTAEELGTPVLAVADGTIVVAQPDNDTWFGWRCDWYGHLVVIQLDQTWQNQPMFALYGHVLNINVSVGDRVVRGEQVAEVGVGGAALVPHLHFELRVGENNFDNTRNPMLWIRPSNSRGVIAGRLVDALGRPWQGAIVTLIGPDDSGEFINTYTYLDDPRHLINPDEWYAENFVFADVVPGEYVVEFKLQETIYRQSVTIIGGELSFVKLITNPIEE